MLISYSPKQLKRWGFDEDQHLISKSLPFVARCICLLFVRSYVTDRNPYGKFTHDFTSEIFICEIVMWNWNYENFTYESFTYEIFICEIVMWNWNNSYMKFSHMKVSHMKFSYVK